MTDVSAMPEPVALLRLIMAANAPGDVDTALERLQATASLRELWNERREVFALAKALQATVDHRAPGNARAIAAAFDRAASLSAEAASALYALGDPALLERATCEVVEHLMQCGALRAAARILDIGCGAGRFEFAISRQAASILGLDSSLRMVEATRLRCIGLPNVAIAHCVDGEPPELRPCEFDLALAVDSFPYIVQSGGDLAARWFAAVARALAPGGSFCLFNFSYRDDPALRHCRH